MATNNNKLCSLYDYSEIVPIVPAVEVLESEDDGLTRANAEPCNHDSTISTPPMPTAPTEDALGDSLREAPSFDVTPEPFSETTVLPSSSTTTEEETKSSQALDHPAILVASGVVGCLVLGPVLATTALGIGAFYVYTHQDASAKEAPHQEDAVSDASGANSRAPASALPRERVLVVHRVHSKKKIFLRRSLDRVGKAAYWVVELVSDRNRIKEPREKVVGAGVTTGILGCLVGGPICGLVVGCGAAVACRKDGVTGDTARAVGEVALSARDKAKAIDRKHQIVKKSKTAASQAWQKAKQVERKHNLLDRTKVSLVHTFRRTTAYLQVHVVEPGMEGVGRAAHWVAESAPAALHSIQQKKNLSLVEPILGTESSK